MTVGRQKSASRIWYHWGLLAICVLQAVWSADFIWRTSFFVEGKRYFCLFDDAMISMRYAQNFACGHGLVWNVGERVEGITNFAWTLIMAVVHLFPLEIRLTSLVVQIAGLVIALLCTMATYQLVRRMGRRGLPAVLAAGMVAFYYPLSYWILMGMETGAVALLLTLTAIVVVRHARGSQPHWADLIAPAVAILVRDDALIPIIALWAALFFIRPKLWRRWIIDLAVILAVPILHAIGRYAYYGDWLPNTYYLKLGVSPLYRCLELGIPFTVRWLLGGGWLPITIITLGTVYNRPRMSKCLMLPIVAAIAYQVWTGGDAWERQRLICPVMPLVFALIAEFLSAVVLSQKRLLSTKARPFVSTVAVSSAVIVMLVINRPFFSEWPRGPIASVADNQLNVQRGLIARDITTPDARVAVFWAGAIPYFSQRVGIDLLGKSDRVVARQRTVDIDHPVPGHNKYNVEYSIHDLQPDLFIPLVGAYRAFETADGFRDDYPVAVPHGWDARYQLRVRKGSPRVHHDRLRLNGRRYLRLPATTE